MVFLNSFSLFVDLLKPFLGSIVEIELENGSLIGILICQSVSYNEGSYGPNILVLKKRNSLLLVRKWIAIKLLEPRVQ